MSTSVSFAKKKSFYMPWQEAYEKIDESEASGLLSEGHKLQAQGESQSTPLPILSNQDLDELQSFRHGEIANSLEDSQMANDLLRLKEKGATFHATFDEERQQVGAYGAYNFLTGQLGLSALEVSFGQAVPTVKPEGKSEFQEMMEKATFADEAVLTTSEKYRSKHWNLIFKAGLENPQTKDVLGAAKLAAKSLKSSDWMKTEAEIGIVRSLFHNFVDSTERLKLVDSVASAVDSKGQKKLKSLKSGVALYELATEPKLSDQEFYARLLNQAKESDVLYLGHALAEQLFPEELQRAKEFAQFAPSKTKSRDQLVVLETILKNPDVKEPGELARLNLERLKMLKSDTKTQLAFLDWSLKHVASTQPRVKFALDLTRATDAEGNSLLKSSSTRLALLQASLESESSDADFAKSVFDGTYKNDRREVIRALTGHLYPQKSKNVAEWTKFSSDDNKANHKYWLGKAIIDNPELKEPLELLEKIPGYVSNNWDNYRFVNDLYFSVLKGRPKDEKARLAIQLHEAKTKDGKFKLKQLTSRRALYTAALNPEVKPNEFLSKSIEAVDDKDKAFVRETILAEHYPQRLSTIDSLIRFSDDDRKKLHYNLLTQAAAAATKDENPVEMVTRAIEFLNKNHKEHYRNTNRFYRLAAKDIARTNKRAKLMVETADAYEADGERQIKMLKSCRALYKAALDPSLTNDEVFGQVLENSDDKDKAYIRRALGSEFFPKLAERVEELTDFSSLNDERHHWVTLFEAAYEHPDIREPGRLVKKATAKFSTSDEHQKYSNAVRVLALKKLSSTNPRAKLALSLGRDKRNNWLLKKWPSVTALYSSALEPNLSETDFLVQAVGGSHKDDKPYLLNAIARPILSDPDLSVPLEIWEKFEAGELTAPEIKEICDTLKAEKKGKGPDTKIGIEDDLIVIGDEELEVDLL